MSDTDVSAADAAPLFGQLYDELKRIAHRHLVAGGATLQTTGLVHEAFLKLARARVEDEAHLLNLASRAMRQVLVDLARARSLPPTASTCWRSNRACYAWNRSTRDWRAWSNCTSTGA
jgi:hypothetical protein